MNDLSITVTQAFVYGKKQVYPRCDKSKIFAQIAGTSTLTKQIVLRIKELGYKVLVVDKEFGTPVGEL